MEPTELSENKYWRDHVEERMIARLTRPEPNEIEVHPVMMYLYTLRVEPVIHKVASTTYIPGFTSEDLESFFWMKLHQVLRQGKYDGSRPAEVFFGVVFKNLIRDIVRMREKAINRGLEEDVMEKHLPFFDAVHANPEDLDE